jgi:hypothetical protein
MAAIEESARLRSLLIGPPFTRGLSNICLNARFRTEPCANVTISDHLAGFRIYGNLRLVICYGLCLFCGDRMPWTGTSRFLSPYRSSRPQLQRPAKQMLKDVRLSAPSRVANISPVKHWLRSRNRSIRITRKGQVDHLDFRISVGLNIKECTLPELANLPTSTEPISWAIPWAIAGLCNDNLAPAALRGGLQG